MSSGSKTAHAHEHAPTTTGRTIHWAFAYDFIVRVLTMNREGALRAESIRLANIAPGATVLDVGCGTGSLTLLAKAAAGSTGAVFGIDPAPEMIAKARQKAEHAGAKIDFQVGVVEGLEFANARFDRVLSSLMMHHLPDDLKGPALAEIYRVLKPGGQLLIVDFGTTEGARGLAGHLHRQAPIIKDAGLRRFVEQAGFSNIEVAPLPTGSLIYLRATRPASASAKIA